MLPACPPQTVQRTAAMPTRTDQRHPGGWCSQTRAMQQKQRGLQRKPLPASSTGSSSSSSSSSLSSPRARRRLADGDANLGGLPGLRLAAPMSCCRSRASTSCAEGQGARPGAGWHLCRADRQEEGCKRPANTPPALAPQTAGHLCVSRAAGHCRQAQPCPPRSPPPLAH